MKLMLKMPVNKTVVKLPSPAKAPVGGIYLDELARADISKSINCLVPWYLMASYLYYHRDTSILSDAFYDRVCHELDENFTKLKHWHKSHVDRKHLKAGTGYMLRFDKMSVRVIIAANTLAHEQLGVPYPNP